MIVESFKRAENMKNIMNTENKSPLKCWKEKISGKEKARWYKKRQRYYGRNGFPTKDKKYKKRQS